MIPFGPTPEAPLYAWMAGLKHFPRQIELTIDPITPPGESGKDPAGRTGGLIQLDGFKTLK